MRGSERWRGSEEPIQSDHCTLRKFVPRVGRWRGSAGDLKNDVFSRENAFNNFSPKSLDIRTQPLLPTKLSRRIAATGAAGASPLPRVEITIAQRVTAALPATSQESGRELRCG